MKYRKTKNIILVSGAPQPELALLYMRDAMPTAAEIKKDPAGTERKRVAGIRALHSILLAQMEAGDVNAGLLHFFRALGHEIVMSPDPIATATRMFGGASRRGPKGPRAGDDRAYEIVYQVDRLRREGSTLDQAVTSVSAQRGMPSRLSVRRIYHERRVEARAAHAMKQLEAQWQRKAR